MKRQISILGLLLALFITAPLASAAADPSWTELTPSRQQRIANFNIVELLKRYHYNSNLFDSDQPGKVYDNYLKTLDPSRYYFTQEDLRGFERWRPYFSDFIRTGNLSPGFIIYKRYLSRVEGRLEYAISLLEKGVESFDFTLSESLVLDREQAPWPENEAALNELWRKRVKDEVLRLRLAGKEPAAIQELLLQRYRGQQKRLVQTRSEDVFQVYINSFTETYDPHTQYMSPEIAENFDINMKLSVEGIGALLRSDSEYVSVVRLIPAGPAEKSRTLAPADRIVGVAQDKGKMVDVIGWRLDEVVKLIRGPKGTRVRLEIIPASNAPSDMNTREVVLTRDSVKLEEQAARKYVLDIRHDGRDYKVGVIHIPAFYLDFKGYREQQPDYRSTTRDVKKLLAELQKEKVEGVVLDLRNNGGGSLQEANELTNLFVKGPSVQVRNNDGVVDVLEDKGSTGPVYKGPLVVLVNRLSASASEIFAGAMQDYNRALIVGNRTFGKGTVQTLQPLNHGELKYTLAKFYRVSGESTQHKGVVPDISYPSVIDEKLIGESALPEALPWDTIKPVIASGESPFHSVLGELEKRHQKRAEVDPDFVFTRQQMALIKELEQEKTLSLNEAERKAQKTDLDTRRLALENTRRKAKGQDAASKLDAEEEETEVAAVAEEKPMEDAYLVESGRILLDYLHLQKSVASK